jgi:hypothetical protein
MYTSQWLFKSGAPVEEGGLCTTLATCADYLEEVRGLAQPSVRQAFQTNLLRHLVCCIAARMLLSELPYDSLWQRATHEELRRLREFVASEMQELDDAEEYLAMLALYRACLCAPDGYTAVSSYNEVCVSL